jgi:hypothetical protein
MKPGPAKAYPMNQTWNSPVITDSPEKLAAKELKGPIAFRVRRAAGGFRDGTDVLMGSSTGAGTVGPTPRLGTGAATAVTVK